jgi:aminoglycoside phosphotransferase (APT) family kinase protein
MIKLFDIYQIQQALEEYYGEKLQGRENIRISDLTYIQGGIAHYMYSFHLEYVEKGAKYSESLILRMGRDNNELRKEFQALEKLYSTPIPVPRVYDISEDILGFGFIIMEKVEGKSMGKAMEGMTKAEQAELWKQFTGILADINTLDWESEGFGFLDPPEGEYGYINRWLSAFREWKSWCKDHNLDPILDWLEENKPSSDRYVLLHEDYHWDNVIVYRGEIAAIVDWDAVSIGDPAYDVCWPPLFFRLFDPSGEWSGGLADNFLRHYKKATGSEVRNLDFYQILKALFFLLLALMVKTHGVQELGVKEEAEMLVHPEFDLPRRCAKFIEEKTGITIQVRRV